MIPFVGGYCAITNASATDAVALVVIFVVEEAIGGELIVGGWLITRIGAVAVGIIGIGLIALGRIVRPGQLVPVIIGVGGLTIRRN